MPSLLLSSLLIYSLHAGDFILPPFHLFSRHHAPFLSCPLYLLSCSLFSSSGSPCCRSITEATHPLFPFFPERRQHVKQALKATGGHLRSLPSFQIFPSLSAPAVVILISLTLSVLPYLSLFSLMCPSTFIVVAEMVACMRQNDW